MKLVGQDAETCAKVNKALQDIDQPMQKKDKETKKRFADATDSKKKKSARKLKAMKKLPA